MDFINGNMRKIYYKYLFAAFGSALVSSIYSAVDMMVVGQYQGPDGTAALAVVAPIWNIIYSLGLLMGIGGSVLFSTIKGETNDQKRANEIFTSSLIGSIVLGIIAWSIIVLFDTEVLAFFGGSESLIILAKRYLFPIKFIFPIYLFNQFLLAYLRNDNDPVLATKAVLTGGLFNIVGDYFFVFTLDMGIVGAGIATTIGTLISFVMMLTHFFGKKNSISIVKPTSLFDDLKDISVTGFATFFVDLAMGIITILFNRQILTYLTNDALSVYGIIINISTFVQACAYSIGQAAQPIISINYGAKNKKNISEVFKYATFTAIGFGMLWVILVLLFPNTFVRIFMSPTESVLQIAPEIIRKYGISFLILPFNIFSTYYFQAMMQPKQSFVVSVARGALISGALILILPLISPNLIWYAMVITEFVVMLYIVVNIIKLNKKQL